MAWFFYKHFYNRIEGMILTNKFSKILLFCTICNVWQSAFAQINFQEIPLNNQVLQRNDQDNTTFIVRGNVTENGHSKVSIKILQNDNEFFNESKSLSSSKDFSFSPTLTAGKFNYTIKILLDEREIKTITRLVVGDVFLLYGQSNALGNAGGDNYQPDRNPFIRYFHTNYADVNNFEWFLPFETYERPGTGAMEFMKFLVNNHNYPVGIISASVGGADMRSLNNRNEQNPTDPNTYYGRMLSQLINSQLKNKLRYVIFRQGESDTNNDKANRYKAEFEKFYNNLNVDLPSLTKFYNIQIDILAQINTPKAGFLREFQRNTKYLYPKISTISSVGTKGFDGLHYTFDGYSQKSYELARIIGKEVYGDNISQQVYSPDLKKIYWENSKLVLEFDEGQEIVYPQDSTINGKTWSMKDFIYFDGNNGFVQSGESIGNKIYLSVSDIGNAKYVSYLPNWYGEWGMDFYKGVHLKNKFGMRAFSFDNIEIGGNNPKPDAINLNVEVNEDIQIKLTWNAKNDLKYHIERSNDNVNFNEIGTIIDNTFYDNQVSLDNTYFYRVYAESFPDIKSNTKNITLKCLNDINLKTAPIVNYVGANNSITAIITINSTKPLSLEANKVIDLNHGFDAIYGSDFSAQIGGCKNN